MRCLFLLIAIILAAGLVVFASDSREPYKGDLDLDGDVDFADFLIFSQNFGKTGGSTTLAVRVDTVYIGYVDNYVASGDSLRSPPGMGGLRVFSGKTPTGIALDVWYLDIFGDRIIGAGELQKDPELIIVAIQHNGNFYIFDSVPGGRFGDLVYRRSEVYAGAQGGLDILIPKSKILDVYNSSGQYGVGVIIKYDGTEYTN